MNIKLFSTNRYKTPMTNLFQNDYEKCFIDLILKTIWEINLSN